MVDFDGKLVGEYNFRPMDPMGKDLVCQRSMLNKFLSKASISGVLSKGRLTGHTRSFG